MFVIQFQTTTTGNPMGIFWSINDNDNDDNNDNGYNDDDNKIITPTKL